MEALASDIFDKSLIEWEFIVALSKNLIQNLLFLKFEKYSLNKAEDLKNRVSGLIEYNFLDKAFT